jgi:hypothetical protein
VSFNSRHRIGDDGDPLLSQALSVHGIQAVSSPRTRAERPPVDATGVG